MTNEITFDQLRSDIRYSQAYYSSKHHPVIVKAQNEAKTKLPYPHTRTERIKELYDQAETAEAGTYLSRFIQSYIFEAEHLSDEQYQEKIDQQERFAAHVKSEMTRIEMTRLAGDDSEGFLTREDQTGKVNAALISKVLKGQ